LDIKLKNSHRLTIIGIAALLLVCSLGMVLAYPAFSQEMEDRLDGDQTSEDVLKRLSYGLVEGNYILYNEVYEETNRAYVLQQYGGDQFDLLRKYMDYEVFDWSGDALLNSSSKATLKELVNKQDTSYAFRAAFTFQEDGEISDIQVSGNQTDERTQYDLEQYLLKMQVGDNQWKDISNPSEVQVVYGVTVENLKSYIESNDYIAELSVYELMENEVFGGFIAAFVVIIALGAVFFSMRNPDIFDNHKVFAVPFELVLVVLGTMMSLGYFVAKVVWITIGGDGTEYLRGSNAGLNTLLFSGANVVMWFIVFGVVFWAFVCISAVFRMKKEYWVQRTLCAKGIRWIKKGGDEYGKKIKRGAGGIWSKTITFCKRQYDVLMHLDFQDKTNRTIFKIIAINFAVLLVVCSMWFYGIAALVIYSIVLFIFLKKYFKDIQIKYKLLLRATNQLAEGDLDTPIGEDMGIFNPIQEELKKIQSGFKKAVEEEVKSERMKTELVTNVSHDLKTPLTAIITYTDLLKTEKEEEKRKEYIEILEKKSLRLKLLIEDLFEISKAASKNVTMNFMQIDIVDLLKQVGLEYDSKIKESNLDFRWSLPEHKIVLWLDSQKTYRIFENLILNITKYAMPHTRVYVDMVEKENQIWITMKNISEMELNFNVDEITDRFVRGDVSRNTEGSGLGLAIAKSFTELQHGTLKISTEADLYKAEIVFPKREDAISGNHIQL
jgi:signal transduction histidine kinase